MQTTRRLTRTIFPALLGLAILTAGGFLLQTVNRRDDIGEKAPVPRHEQPLFMPTADQLASLKIIEVTSREFHSLIKTDGYISYNEDHLTQVFSPYSGRVSRLIARPGAIVKKGDPLLAVEASEFIQGQNDAAAARATLSNAQAIEKRQRELYDAGAVAQKDWQQAQADLVAAEAALAAARGKLRILGKSDVEINALESAPGSHAETVMTAPIAGTVIQRQVGLGQYITSAAAGAANPVFTIGDLSTVWLIGNVREGDAPQLRIGQPAEVRVLALPGRVFKGWVDWIGAGVDPVTHRLQVRVQMQNPDGDLKPQMFANFTIATGDAGKAPAVPQSAVMVEDQSAQVFVMAADGSIAARPVKIGRSNDDLLEVVSGLKAGERVVTAGTLFVDRVIGDR